MLTNWKFEQAKELKNITNSLNDIQKTNIEIEKSLNAIAIEQEELKLRINNIDHECKENRAYILVLEEKIEDLQRDARSTTIELKNVPKLSNETKEDLSGLVQKLSESINIKIGPTDIRNIFRIHGKNDTNKPIIVELSSTTLKQNMLKGIKSFNIKNSKNKLNASHLGLKDNSTPVFTAEYLTPKANRLYFLARDLVRTDLYQFCWTSQGRIFVRKSEGTPAILIKNEEQVTQLRNKA